MQKQPAFSELLPEIRRRVFEIAKNSCTFGRIAAQFPGGEGATVEMTSGTYRMPELEHLAQRFDSGLLDPIEDQLDDLRPYLIWLAAHLNPPLIVGVLEISIAHGAMASLDVHYGPQCRKGRIERCDKAT